MRILFFALCLFSNLYCRDFRKNSWEKTDFIWNCGILPFCDKWTKTNPVQFFETNYSPLFPKYVYEPIQSGDIIWLQCRFVSHFYHQVLPNITAPFVLLINDGDESFPSQSGLTEECLEKFLSDERVIHIFAQNCDIKGKHPKVTHFPIGLDFHTIAYKGPQGGWGEIGSPLEQESLLKHTFQKSPPTYLRKKMAFVDFQFSDSMRDGEHRRHLQFGEDRTTIFSRLLHTGLIHHGKWVKRSSLWQIKGQYAFSISPHGNGLDCHRTWEDLILGCIVIVKTSPLDPLYEGLPVVIVQDWSEITPQNMEKWLAQYGDASTNPAYREKLTHNYWMHQILSKAAPYKK